MPQGRSLGYVRDDRKKSYVAGPKLGSCLARSRKILSLMLSTRMSVSSCGNFSEGRALMRFSFCTSSRVCSRPFVLANCSAASENCFVIFAPSGLSENSGCHCVNMPKRFPSGPLGSTAFHLSIHLLNLLPSATQFRFWPLPDGACC